MERPIHTAEEALGILDEHKIHSAPVISVCQQSDLSTKMADMLSAQGSASHLLLHFSRL